MGFGRKVRNLVDSDTYKDIFPDVALQSDSKAAGRWATNYGGDYFAIGIGGAVTGKGADLLIIDDPHSEQEAALSESNPEIYDKTYEWYTSGPRQRLQPGGAIVIVMTRWSKRDLTGQILKDAAANDSLDEWEVIEFPAILPSDKPLWPEFWELNELLKVNLKGNDLAVSPWLSLHMTVDHAFFLERQRVSIVPWVTVHWEDDSYLTIWNVDKHTDDMDFVILDDDIKYTDDRRDSWYMLHAGVRLFSGEWMAELYGYNLTNEVVQYWGAAAENVAKGSFSMPRTYGFRIGWDF